MSAILFDADGVLLDSMPCYERAWSRWGAPHGIGLDRIWQVAIGRRPSDIVAIVAPNLDTTDELRAFNLLLNEELASVRAMPGARDLLRQLRDRPWAIVTSGYRASLITALTTAELPVPAVLVTGEDVSRAKPSPDGFRLAAKRLRAHPAECIAVEDAPAGIEAARAAGMTCVAVATTHDANALARADTVVGSLAEVSSVLLGILRRDASASWLDADRPVGLG